MITGCSLSENQPSNESSKTDGDPVINVEDDNDGMIQAIAKAQEKIPYFLENWNKNPDALVSVKIPCKTSTGSKEHIWFEPVSIDGEQITATCGNNPQDVPNLKLGDSKTVPLKELSDWMIIVENKCYGGYTLQAMLKMHPEMQSQFNMDFQDI